VGEREDNPIYELSAESDEQSMRECEQVPQLSKIELPKESINMVSESAKARMSWW